MVPIKYFAYVILNLFHCYHVNGAKVTHCNVLVTGHFGNCTNREGELFNYEDDRKNRVYSTNTTGLDGLDDNNEGCTKSNMKICRKIFNIARIKRQSFSSKTLVHISDMLFRCCGVCAKYYLDGIGIDNLISNISIIEQYDIVYPVLGRFFIKKMHGYHFIPVLQIPSAFFITLGQSEREMATNMIISCLKMWPLFLICVLLSSIAGFVAWAAEAPSGNEIEFPTNFFRGMYEGFWWSFVSMTTVGYGDKVPKSVFGRVFSVIWILIGITIIAIFTASLTTEIMKARSPDTPDMNGKRVGVLKHRLHDAIMIAQHGGILHDVDFNDTVVGVSNLLHLLEKNVIDGALINSATYFYFSRKIMEDKEYKNMSNYINRLSLRRTEKSFRDNYLVAGMLVKSRSDYEYFKRYFESNWVQIQACYLYNLNYKTKEFHSKPYSSVEGLFYPFFYWSIGIIGIIVCIGVVYELRVYLNRRKKEEKDNNPKKDTEKSDAIKE